MNKFDLEKHLLELYSILDYKRLSSNAISIYFILLQIARMTSYSSEFKVANTVLMSKINNLNLSALQRARNELINAKLINYKRGNNQAEMPTYQLLEIHNTYTSEQANEQADEQANEQANEQALEQADEHIKTKLNLLYIYIIYGEKNRRKNWTF